ncbi:TonB-dependent receptor [Sulfitobacter sp. F26169L]|uniref:TonB-dependent receptor plug domain-containing protein n=1 Tax=Sulfitobacter sp. F26169L TaxID=2996015 RepID=UPI002260A00C|nr:TonB-dependent receptor [Sulfitobacter sp. F26169L]MCX7567420.1 TonB-dependent receptor [Sulfitobacter sp. F26169L]
MLRSYFLASVAIVPSLITPAAAQQAFDLGELIISGSLSPVARDQTGSTVEVLEADDITARDTTVIKRLDRLPGISSTANGGLGTNASLQVRGLPARYVVVRVNGIDMNDPSGTQNAFNFGALTPSGIERIEVLKGSQSALYGSEAIGGVIDITTYRPTKDGFSVRTGIEAGSYGTTSGTLSLGHLTDRSEIAFTYGRIVSDGFSARANDDEDDSFRQTTLTFTGGYAVTDDFKVGIAVNSRDGVLEIDRSTTDNSGQNYFEELGARVYGELVTGNVTHTLAYSYFDIERRDPTGFTTLFTGERERLSYLATAALANGYTLNFGLDRTEEAFDSGGQNGEEDTVSAQAELLFKPTDNVDLSAALRYDDNSAFGGKATGRLAGVWRPREDLALRAVFGTGFRAPSLYERFSVYGDAGLSPEESRSFELGIEKTYGQIASIKATLFYTEIDDLIAFDGASTACGSGFGCYNQVAGTTKSRGIELSGTYALNNTTKLYGNYTYTDAKTDGARLQRTPRHDLVLGLDTDITNRLSASMDVRFVGDVVPSAFAPADHKVGDYTLVGAGVSYDLTDSAQAYLRVENLFDEDYETAGGYNTPGRSAYFGLRADF